ncbi:hypothetical protein L873DRAFT_1845413 [Choiromyces venosus 120613-1]|uniref:Cyclin-D1-binding protein 1-like N-terminal domain-containing protein n=1 Tax=Choiromyces venosus 120613-1 TaxID=1336337 RepID=A0A3N4JDZ2_9PEZI|nr:hypothetical protein L873DRAFT_1845413 [Choiromyces venosus 120613-1]
MTLKPINSEITTLKSLINQTRPLLSTPPPPPPTTTATTTTTTTTSTTITPYPLLRDLSTLLRAHSTNLSIALRPPNLLYPAAAKSIQEITSLIPQYLPAIHALPEIPSLRRSVIRKVEDLFTSITQFFNQTSEEGRDRLSSTGAIWSSCDALIALEAGGGTHGVIGELIKTYEALISDAAGELRAWVVEVGEDEDEGFVDDSAQEETPQEFWEKPIAAGRRRDGEVRGLVEVVLKKIRLLEILLGAVRKRRLADDGLVSERVLEEVVQRVKAVSEAVDDVGMGFYEDEVGEAVEAQKRFQEEAVKLIDLVVCKDGGVEDKYTKWFHNCREAILKEG